MLKVPIRFFQFILFPHLEKGLFHNSFSEACVHRPANPWLHDPVILSLTPRSEYLLGSSTHLGTSGSTARSSSSCRSSTGSGSRFGTVPRWPVSGRPGIGLATLHTSVASDSSLLQDNHRDHLSEDLTQIFSQFLLVLGP